MRARFAAADDPSGAREQVRLSFVRWLSARAANGRPWDWAGEWHEALAAADCSTSVRDSEVLEVMIRAARAVRVDSSPRPPAVFGGAWARCLAWGPRRGRRHWESRWPARTGAAARSWNRRSDCSCCATCPCCRRGRAAAGSTATLCRWTRRDTPAAGRSRPSESSSTGCESCRANLSTWLWWFSLSRREEGEEQKETFMNENHRALRTGETIALTLSRELLFSLSSRTSSSSMMMHEAQSQTKQRWKCVQHGELADGTYLEHYGSRPTEEKRKKNKEEKEKKKAEKMMPGLVVVDWMAEKFDSPTHPKCPRESLCSVVRWSSYPKWQDVTRCRWWACPHRDWRTRPASSFYHFFASDSSPLASYSLAI